MYDSSVSKIYENGRSVSVFSIAVPKFFEMIFVQALGTVNTLMLTGYSQEAVAAISVAEQIQTLVVTVLNIIIFGMTVILSVELGKGEKEEAGRVAATAFLSVFAVSLVLGAAMSHYAEQLVSFMNLKGDLKAVSAEYFSKKIRFIFILTSTSCLNNVLICNGYAKETFVNGILSNVLNVLYGYIILYSGLRVSCSKITALAYFLPVVQPVMFIFAVFCIKKRRCPFLFCFDFKHLKRILKVGVPTGLGNFSFSATQTISTGFMAMLGINAVNAKVYVANIVAYTSKIGSAISQGHGVLVGRYKGKGEIEKIKILYRQNLFLAVLSNVLLSFSTFVFAKSLVSLFTGNKEIINLACVVMGVDIMVEIARAVNNVTEQSLNANGDVAVTFAVPLFTCWIFGVFSAYVLGIKLGLGLIGCWLGFALDEAAKAILYVMRWKSEKWKNINI